MVQFWCITVPYVGRAETDTMERRDLYTTLATRIRSGRYESGSRLPSERALAEELGAHRNTISRVIARLADAGLVETHPGRRPIVRSAGIDARASRTVALCMGNEPRFRSFQHVLRGCEMELSAHDFHLVFRDTLAPTIEGTRQKEMAALKNLEEQPVAGLIVWCQDVDAAPPTLKRLRAAGTVIVAIDRQPSGFPCDFVGVDNIHGATVAVEHLLSLGHRRVAYATYAEEIVSAVMEREDAYRNTMRHHGIPDSDLAYIRIPADTSDSAIMEVAARYARTEDRPTAIFCVNDIMATKLTRSLLAAGLDVPEDIAIVGFDDLEGLTVHSPILSTMRQPYELLGRHAARLILWRLNNPEAPIRHVLLDTSLVVRSSTVSSAPAPSPVFAGTAIDPLTL